MLPLRRWPAKEKAMHMKVSADQFTLNGDKLTHTPSGAVFWMGDKDVVLCEPGIAGREMTSGHEYDVEELKQAAWTILQTEKSKKEEEEEKDVTLGTS